MQLVWMPITTRATEFRRDFRNCNHKKALLSCQFSSNLREAQRVLYVVFSTIVLLYTRADGRTDGRTGFGSKIFGIEKQIGLK